MDKEEYYNKVAFVGGTGKLYVANPVNELRYAVYSSVDAYNKRLSLPDYISV